MHDELAELLHPRILNRCKDLFEQGHYPEAVHQAMCQVEIAVKERSGETQLYGVKLINRVFDKQRGISLRMPFDEEKQEQGRAFYESMFSYLRNYVAHGGSNVSKVTCIRAVVLASEVLEVVGASKRCLSDMGGVDALARGKFFDDAQELYRLLKFLDGQRIIDDVVDGFYEDSAAAGFLEEQLELVVDVGLVEYVQKPKLIWDSFPNDPSGDWVTSGSFGLTTLGQKALKDSERR